MPRKGQNFEFPDVLLTYLLNFASVYPHSKFVQPFLVSQKQKLFISRIAGLTMDRKKNIAEGERSPKGTVSMKCSG